jgi:hypothetical protein
VDRGYAFAGDLVGRARGHQASTLINPAEATVLISLLVVSMATSAAISPYRPKPFPG